MKASNPDRAQYNTSEIAVAVITQTVFPNSAPLRVRNAAAGSDVTAWNTELLEAIYLSRSGLSASLEISFGCGWSGSRHITEVSWADDGTSSEVTRCPTNQLTTPRICVRSPGIGTQIQMPHLHHLKHCKEYPQN